MHSTDDRTADNAAYRVDYAAKAARVRDALEDALAHIQKAEDALTLATDAMHADQQDGNAIQPVLDLRTSIHTLTVANLRAQINTWDGYALARAEKR